MVMFLSRQDFFPPRFLAAGLGAAGFSCTSWPAASAFFGQPGRGGA
jgi:hypothetical protein